MVAGKGIHLVPSVGKWSSNDSLLAGHDAGMSLYADAASAVRLPGQTNYAEFIRLRGLSQPETGKKLKSVTLTPTS